MKPASLFLVPCRFLLASQHPLVLSVGTFSCVYDFKWLIICFSVSLDCYFTAMMFVNVCRSTSLQPVSARCSTSMRCFKMLHGSSGSEVRTIKLSSVSEERMEDATAASALFGMDSRSASSWNVWCKLAIWLQRPALRCLSIYLGGGRQVWREISTSSK